MSAADLKKYHEQEANVYAKANQFEKAFIAPVLDSTGGDARFQKNSQERHDALKVAIQGTILDNAGDDGVKIADIASRTVSAYHSAHGEMPSAERMAASWSTIENMLMDSAGADASSNKISSIMDAATDSMSSSDGITKRNHQVALITPVTLSTVTQDAVAYIPPNHDKSEIFVIDRIAGSTFGDMEKGDVIDETFRKQYATMDQYHVVGEGDGVNKDFTFDISALKGIPMPIRKHYIKVYHDKRPVGEDMQAGIVSGMFDVGGTNVTVATDNAGVDYADGKFSFAFSQAPAAGIQVAVKVDIDIEKAPQLIPYIEHEMKSFTLRPHESAITDSVTIQAVYAASREFGVALRSMQTNAARNVLAAEKDRRRLVDFWRFAGIGREQFKITPPNGISQADHDATAQKAVTTVSHKMLKKNKKSGAVIAYAALDALTVWLSIPGAVKTRPGYKPVRQPHYVGMLYGYIKLFCDPDHPNTLETLFAGKGANYGDAGYVAADAISAIQFPHPVGAPSTANALRHENTLYELGYRDMHPYKGEDYFGILEFTF